MTKQKTDKYRDAGVDIDKADAFVSTLKSVTASTKRPGSDASIGGFGGLFDLKAAGYEDPLLVAATDGVGTKVTLAAASGINHGVGIDLVAMCVNDLVVQGAEPLFFLDYMATSALDPKQMLTVAEGIADGCRQAGCALIGGETAEMPGLYQGKDYDLAGFCVGAVNRDAVITGKDVMPGDILIGLESSGPHANGFSLIRKILADSGYDNSAALSWTGSKTLAEALLEPTKIYVKPLLKAMKVAPIKAMAHITGGGFTENIPRSLPEGCAARVDVSSWDRPDVFHWLQDAGDLSVRDMVRTFNCGIGMVIIIHPDHQTAVLDCLKATDIGHAVIGTVVEKDQAWRCAVSGPDGSWGEAKAWTVTDVD